MASLSKAPTVSQRGRCCLCSLSTWSPLAQHLSAPASGVTIPPIFLCVPHGELLEDKTALSSLKLQGSAHDGSSCLLTIGCSRKGV